MRLFAPRLYPPKALDINAADLAFGVGQVATLERPEAVAARIEASWSDAGDALACLSVRSGLDLWLRAVAFPAGSEVAISAITIPDMARILAHHELVPVPVDVDPCTMAMDPASLEAAIGPRTRAVMVAHLFGGRHALDRVIEIAHRHGLPVIEDCAQAFSGDRYTGHEQSAAAMFSFGPIKTATCLGGGLLRIADPEVRHRMRAIQAADPPSSNCAFAARAAKYSLLKLATHADVYGAIDWCLSRAGVSTDRLATRLSRGFGTAELIPALRHRPSAALLRMMERRLGCDHGPEIARRIGVCKWLSRRLASAAMIPGGGSDEPIFWLLPAVVDNPVALVGALREAGFQASRGATSLTALRAPAGRPEPLRAQAIMDRVVYLPVNHDMPADALARLCATTIRVARPLGLVHALATTRSAS